MEIVLLVVFYIWISLSLTGYLLSQEREIKPSMVFSGAVIGMMWPIFATMFAIKVAWRRWCGG